MSPRAEPPFASLDTSDATARALRGRASSNVLRMGHCAPTVMQTLLDVSGTEGEWLVRLTAGLPGGIGNTGGECGGLTAPLVVLGLRCGHEEEHRRLPLVAYQASELLDRFCACEDATDCRRILGRARLPLRCIGVMQRASVLCAQSLASAPSMPAEREEAYGRLYAHWAERRFHCAHAVFRHLETTIPVNQELLDASSAFLGGTIFRGMTCSALTAGVMALGLALGEIENSRLRVLRMLATMAAGGDALADERNAFNKTINRGHRLAQWLTTELGSIRCRDITQCDFSTMRGVERYIESDGTTRCEAIAWNVSREVSDVIAAERARLDTARVGGETVVSGRTSGRRT